MKLVVTSVCLSFSALWIRQYHQHPLLLFDSECVCLSCAMCFRAKRVTSGSVRSKYSNISASLNCFWEHNMRLQCFIFTLIWPSQKWFQHFSWFELRVEVSLQFSTKIKADDFESHITINTLVLVVCDQMELVPDPDPDEEGTKISVCDDSY